MDFDEKRKTVNVGSNSTIIIDKMYGPTIFCNLRITARSRDCKWIVEREVIGQDDQDNDITSWETMCEIDGQESISFRGE